MITLKRTSTTIAVALLVAALAVVAYTPALRGAFLWDDDAHVTRPELRGTDGLRRIWTEPEATQQYYPVTHTAFWVQHRLWGDRTVGYHVTTLLLHLAGAWMLWRILLRLGVPGAGFAAALFALHPVHVESVAWISELKNTLSGALGLGAVLLLLQTRTGARWSREGARTDAGSSTLLYVLALVVFAAALLAKSVAGTLALALPILGWWQRGRLSVRDDVVPILPFVGLAVAAGLTTIWVERELIGATGTEFDLSAADRILIAGRSVWFSLKSLFAPVGLTFVYPRWQIDPSEATAWVAPVAVAALLAALWRLRDTIGRGPLAALAFYVVVLGPALGFVDVYPFRFSFVADHFQYLASIGPLAFASAALARLATQPGMRPRAAALVVGVALLVVMAGLTWREAHEYRSGETLWRATVRDNPGSAIGHNNLAIELARRGRVDEAIASARRAGELDPSSAEAHFNLGSILARSGRPEEAVASYRRAAELRPGFAHTHLNLADVLAGLDRDEEALAAYEAALRAEPRLVSAHVGRATLLLRRGRTDDAIEGYRTAARLRPTEPQAWLGLAVAHERRGELGPAVQAYRNAVRLRPDDAVALRGLAVAERRRGRFVEAAQAFTALGRVLASRRMLPEAVAALELAVGAEPADPDAWYWLGEALAVADRRDDAVRAWTTATRLDPGSDGARRAQARLAEPAATAR